ncbi:C40 family peptidase, partial [Candidatus Pacearchaeota archaeon]|nr:C40 family peptidase [Candidatus Pacearchaeota archaeon]
MVGSRKEFILGISGLALLTSLSLSYQNPNFSKKENLENKTINYLINDSIKKQEEKIIPKRKEFVENAKKYIGKEYQWGGRLTKENPGLDCLGLIFLAYSKTYEKKWTEISVNPSEIVKKEQLGKPVKGLDGILTKNIDFSKLEEGDIIYLLSRGKIEDKPLSEINGIKYWPWHTGIYSDKKNNLFLHANPANKVTESNFKEYLK